jgi:hypothetical protein
LPKLITQGQKTVQLQFKINSPLMTQLGKVVDIGLSFQVNTVRKASTAPAPIKAYPAGRVKGRPIWGSFSSTMNKVARPIHTKLIVPPTKAKAISAQQQPKQISPSSTPMTKARRTPGAQRPMK